MSQILSIIQEEWLASINWDTRYILNVLNTIMHVLREHEDRLDAHDQQLPLLTEKTYSEHLNQQLIAVNSEVSQEFENTRKRSARSSWMLMGSLRACGRSSKTKAWRTLAKRDA
jgi:hypothetical protein